MGTRGAYGYRIYGRDKVTYNHFDSYPDALGRGIMAYISAMPISEIKEVASRIELVDRDSHPTPLLIERYRKYADLQVSGHKYEDWYCLLRNCQGDLLPYHYELSHMPDYHDFLLDSLFCEWAYIINLDTERLETYRGFNKDPESPGRYARKSVEDSDGYKGVALINETPLATIKRPIINSLVQALERLGRHETD